MSIANKKSIWDKFTNVYSLSKTLRFELKLVGKNGDVVSSKEMVESLKEIIAQDKKIAKAYNDLKPILDKVHEQVIDASLESKAAKEINFNEYYETYKASNDQAKKELETIEKKLRTEIGKTYSIAADEVTKNPQLKGKGKAIFKKIGIEKLFEAGLLEYLKQNIQELAKLCEKNSAEYTGENGHLSVFKGFWGYFATYNQNRNNYYETEKEKATAIATRIVHENLRKFCSNSVQFEKNKDSYKLARTSLKDKGKTTQIKDTRSGDMIESEDISEAIFNIDNFSKCLSQKEIEKYNCIIGGYNLVINLYNQQLVTKEAKKGKLLYFKTLYKQIGCGDKKALFDAIQYDTKEQQEEKEPKNTASVLSVEGVLENIFKAGDNYFNTEFVEDKTNSHTLINWLTSNQDWDSVHWSKSALSKISNKYLANFQALAEKVKNVLLSKDKLENATKEKYKKIARYDKKKKGFEFKDTVQLSILFEIIDEASKLENDWTQTFFKNSVLENERYKDVIKSEDKPSKTLISLICCDLEAQFNEFQKNKKAIVMQDFKKEENILKIKEFLDACIEIVRTVKLFYVSESKIKKSSGGALDAEFSNMLDAILRPKDIHWTNAYDTIRNYLTKKPQDDAKENKIQLNFENSNLLGGWPDGQEKIKGSVIIKKSDEYFVGILIERKIFDTGKEGNPIYQSPTENAGRLILKNITSKTVLGKGFISYYGEKYQDMSKRNNIEAIEKAQNFIRDYKMTTGNKTYLEKYPKLNSIVKKKYSDKSEFHNDLDQILKESYECEFTPINWKELLNNIEKKNLYLFQIYSKDFSKNRGVKSKNSFPNLQTLYFENLFHENSNIQLQANAKIFFRNKVAFPQTTLHPKNEPIKRRTDGEIASVFKHDIIKNKRFTEEKIQFHFPISLNYDNVQVSGKTPKDYIKPVNKLVNETFLKEDVQFLGIDRGEKHLIYYSLVDKECNIKEQGHFDSINGKNYGESIQDRADKRKQQKLEWLSQDKIAPLKEGYISLAIHEILKKCKDENGNFKPTFIVLEGLTQGFKRGRQKFEKNVYQKFELALAKKLNFLVDKNAKVGIGSVSKALQLTPLVKKFEDIENQKQFGIMLYTRANYTSITDPATGWYKTIYLKTGTEENIKKQILDSFEEIAIDKNGDYYFQYKDKQEKTWRLWSGKNGEALERYRNKKNDQGIYEPEFFNVKQMLKGLFEDFDKEKSLKMQIEEDKKGVQLSKISEHTAWESLRFAIELIQQIRNSGDPKQNQDDNFLLSCVRDEKGNHFDSRKSEKGLPCDADANGAYNIARKGIIMYKHIEYKHIEKAIENKEDDVNLFISDEEWSLWLTDKKKWENRLDEFVKYKEKKSKSPAEPSAPKT